MGYSLRIPILFSFCYCPSRFIIDNEILPLSTSTCSTQTVTTSPTDTISIGGITNCYAILEICKSPSSPTPTSTKTQKNTTSPTAPSSSNPSSQSATYNT